MLTSLGSLVHFFGKHNIMSGFYYAVANGRKPGIYETWEECKEQVHKFTGPIYKKFRTSAEAQLFINQKKSNPLSSSINSKPLPSNVLPLGRKVPSASKRVRDSIESSENNNYTNAKRKKTTSTSNAGSSGISNSNFNNRNGDKKNFDMDPDGFVNVYTDGACSSNGKRGAKAGIGVYFGDNSPLNISEPVVGRATNNMAEIQAVTRAAERAHEAGMTKIRVHTDSQFLIKCITQWMRGWKARGWMTAANKPVINKEELLEMESALKSLTVQWNHVRGHCGIHGNEEADRLAREGAERYNK